MKNKKVEKKSLKNYEGNVKNFQKKERTLFLFKKK